MSKPDDFDWFGEDAADVVIQEQPRTAIYCNPSGAIVIRQAADSGYNENDPYVLIRPEFARLVAKRLIELATPRETSRQLSLLETVK